MIDMYDLEAISGVVSENHTAITTSLLFHAYFVLDAILSTFC